jgi:acetyl-CoA/propionyl-CoA carboxylase biotin carboxyl carrier protein
VEVQGKRLEVVLPAGLGRTGGAAAPRPAGPGGTTGRARRSARSGAGRGDGDTLTCPMQGTIVKIVAGEGQRVSAGDPVVILEAMKMEQPLTAHKDGTGDRSGRQGRPDRSRGRGAVPAERLKTDA